jgi:sugar lactone lactonase YvrE
VDGLPSGKSSLPSGDTVGAADVAFIGGNLYVLLAGGGCSHGNPDTPNGVIKVDVDHGTWSYVANLSAFQAANPQANPGPSVDDREPDGTWYGMVAVGGNLFATEPNHQEIDRISTTTGKVTRVADVSPTSATWVGPTGIAYHGNFFFGNLAPFPIAPGSANVFKLTPSGNFKAWTTGLTTVVGLAFDHRDRLYVLELSDAPGFPNPGFGKLVRISPSGQVQDILAGLVVPTAMTIGPDGAIYISNFGAAPPGLGQIIRVPITD